MNSHLLYSSLKDQGVILVAVSKTKPASLILDLYDQGIRDFGENRVQEMVEKHQQLPNDIRWHMIGNLQKNKVKYIASFVHMIHSVSSESLLKMVNKEAVKNNRIIKVLLQIKIAEEDTKSGMDKEEAIDLVKRINLGEYDAIQLKGYMGMATFTDNMSQVQSEFRSLKDFSQKVTIANNDTDDTPIISMGMSGDYKLAIEEGATMVRIGSLIFGERNNKN